MGKYLHHYETESAFTAAYNGEEYLEPWVSYTDETEGEEHVDYNKQPVPPITVKTITLNREQGTGNITGYTLEDVTEYMEQEVSFDDVLEAAYHVNGRKKYMFANFYEIDPEDVNDLNYFETWGEALDTNSFGHGDCCGTDLSNERMTWSNDAPYNGVSFSDGAFGKTLTLVTGEQDC